MGAPFAAKSDSFNVLSLIRRPPFCGGFYSPVAGIELILGATFFFVAAGAIVMTRVNGGIALIWPASAVAAAVLIRLPKVRWVSTGAVLFAACTLVNVTVAHRDWPISLIFSCINGAEIALTVWAFRSLIRLPYPNISIEQAALMTALFGIAIPGLSAVAAGAALEASYGVAFTHGTLQWWASRTAGACLIGPPIILFSFKSMRHLVSGKYLAQNLATLLILLLGCWLSIRYVKFPFVVIGMLLLIAAFRVGGFGASLLSLFIGLTIAALWSFGVRPAGLESAPVASSLEELPLIALLATILPPIAVGLGTDGRRAAVLKLNSSERRFRESMDHSPIGMLIADLNGVWGYTNLALQTMLGFSAEEFRALPPGGPSEAGEWTSSAARWQRLLSGEIHFYDIERRFRHRDGHWIWTHVAVSLLRNEEGQPLNLIAQIESLQARRLAEEKLAEERERLRITLSSITDAVITTDADTRITYINPAGETLLGQVLADLVSRRLDEVISLTDPRTSKAAPDLVAQSRLHAKAFRRETACVLHRPDGVACYVKDVVSPVLEAQGFVTGIVVVLQDASADVALAQELNHRASHDALTGLLNRFAFQLRLKESFDRAAQLDLSAAVLAIDLDRFKAVNDTGGHAAGDAILRRVGEVLRLIARRSDIVARLGGDEMAIILPQCPPARIHAVAAKILQALNPLEVVWEGATYTIGASVGLAMIGPQFASEVEWFEAADRACYHAKQDGRGQLRVAMIPATTTPIAGKEKLA